MPGESCRRRLRYLLLCLCDVFRALINSLVCWFCTGALAFVPFQILIFSHCTLSCHARLICNTTLLHHGPSDVSTLCSYIMAACSMALFHEHAIITKVGSAVRVVTDKLSSVDITHQSWQCSECCDSRTLLCGHYTPKLPFAAVRWGSWLNVLGECMCSGCSSFTTGWWMSMAFRCRVDGIIYNWMVDAYGVRM